MTYIRIEPTEMETASRELQAQGDAVGQALTSLRAQSTQVALPPAVAGQVDATLATLERTLHDIRTELVLEALLLALRGILALEGSAVAGLLLPPPSPTPRPDVSALYGMGAVIGGGSTPDVQILNPDGTPADTVVLSGTIGPPDYRDMPLIRAMERIDREGLSAAPSPGATFAGPTLAGLSRTEEPRGTSFSDWANSPTLDSDGDGVRNNWDVNPGTYDREYTDRDPLTRPTDF